MLTKAKRLRRGNTVLNSFHGCVSNTPKKFSQSQTFMRKFKSISKRNKIHTNFLDLVQKIQSQGLINIYKFKKLNFLEDSNSRPA
jgi:hypothetical protein